MREKYRFGIDRFGNRFAAAVAICSAGAMLLAFLVVATPVPASAQVFVGVSVTIAPPPLPVYVQPICPGPGYIWTPGYWAWDPNFGYYWVPGTWVLAPYPGWLWTPGYWGWYDGAYVWYEGYWGPVVGFYGGINYGFGYNGYGYYGGYWDRGTFYYNRRVNNIRTTNITTIYSNPVPRSATTRRVSYNGGSGGITLRPTATQLSAARQRGSAPIAAQREQIQAAQRNRNLRASINHGRPPIAATPRPGAFRGPGVVGARGGGAPYHAPQPIRTAPVSPRERAVRPSGPEERRPAAAPRQEAPPAMRNYPAAPRGEQQRPGYRYEEPRREQPAPNMFRQPMSPRPAPETPRTAPFQPQGGERREEGVPRR